MMTSLHWKPFPPHIVYMILHLHWKPFPPHIDNMMLHLHWKPFLPHKSRMLRKLLHQWITKIYLPHTLYNQHYQTLPYTSQVHMPHMHRYLDLYNQDYNNKMHCRRVNWNLHHTVCKSVTESYMLDMCLYENLHYMHNL